MKKIIICGDSWMSPNNRAPGTHFSEIFAKHYQAHLEIYARSAMGNGGIILQVEHALKQNPDLILLGCTSSDRIEFKVTDNDSSDTVTINDLVYGPGHDDISCLQRKLNDSAGSLKSEALLQFVNDDYHNGSCLFPLEGQDAEIKKKVIQTYFKELYHHAWKVKVDRYMWYAMFHKLNLSKIPYIICYDDRVISDDELSLLNEFNIFYTKFSTFRKPFLSGEMDPGYHTTVDTQKEIAAALIDHYEKYFRQFIV